MRTLFLWRTSLQKREKVKRKEVETKLKEMAVFLFQTHGSNKEDATASKSLEFLKSIMSAVKGQEVDLPGLAARSKKEDKHTCLANIKPPVIKVDALMDLFKSVLAKRNKSKSFKIIDEIQFRSSLLKDDVGTYMNWTKNFNLADDDEIRKLHTLVVEASMFGTNHAALLYTDVNKMDNDSLVDTAEEHKIGKYLLEVLSQILGEFTSSWVSCMDQQEHQPNNKIIFCSKNLHMMYCDRKRTPRKRRHIPKDVTVVENSQKDVTGVETNTANDEANQHVSHFVGISIFFFECGFWKFLSWIKKIMS